MDQPITRLQRRDWAKDDTLWRGHVEGQTIGTGVTVLFFSNETVGAGPPLHIHPYDEVFIVRSGHARFQVGRQTTDAEAGDILVAPANTPHKFTNIGPGRLETTDIHLNDRWIQTNLDEADPAPTD